MIAAERTHRRARLIELHPLSCDIAVRRWEKLSGHEAVLATTGQTFAEIESLRSIDSDATGRLKDEGRSLEENAR